MSDTMSEENSLGNERGDVAKDIENLAAETEP